MKNFHIGVAARYKFLQKKPDVSECLKVLLLLMNSPMGIGWQIKLHLFPFSVCDSTSFDPLGRQTVTAGRDHYFHTCCPYVRASPLFKPSKTKQQWSLLARLWVWQSRSLMTPVLLFLYFFKFV